jgi:hypothetical protein
MRQCFGHGAPREAQRRCCHRCAKQIEGGHRDLEAIALEADQTGGRHPAVVEVQARQRMRHDDIDALGDLEARCGRIDDEGRDATRAAFDRIARACEHDVEVGNAAIRDPGFFAIEHPGIAVAPRRALQRRDVGAGGRLGQRKGGDRAAVGHTRQPVLTLRSAAEQRDRPAAQALHRKCKIGQPRMARQRFADQANGAGVDGGVRAAMPDAGHGVAQPAALAQARDQCAADGVHIDAMRVGEVRDSPGVEFTHQDTVVRIEERPVENIVFH